MNNLPPVALGLLAGLVTWLFTAAGAAAVYLSRQFSQKTLDIMLGVTGGIMLAAAIWSLLNPALELAAKSWGIWRFVPVSLGFVIGAAMLRLLDFILPHIHAISGMPDGPKTRLPRNFLLVLAITLHNIPEAFAVGVGFGATVIDPEIGMGPAILLMLAIGFQNLPEGLAVSMPLLTEGMSRNRAFFYGQLSGLVEPIAAMFGALLASIALPFLPWALSIAAGAMIFVTIEDVIPESQASGNSDASTMGFILGFVSMMSLDVVFG